MREAVAAIETAEANKSAAVADRWEYVDELGGAWLSYGRHRIAFPHPLPHQVEPFLADCPKKVLRWGRRGGKTVISLQCAIRGHGPVGTWSMGEGEYRQEWEGPRFRGVLSGKDVVWVVRDHTQGNNLWFDWIQKLFPKGTPGVYTNETLRCVKFTGAGTLWIKSNENIDSVRGIGANLAGALVDEAAHQHLRYALQSVLVPALADNEGWLVLMSTTNCGSDGDEERPEGPSHFNLLCEEIQASRAARERGEPEKATKTEDWQEWHRTPRDNPRLTAKAVRDLYAEYTGRSVAQAEELDAALLRSKKGLQFEGWRKDLLETAATYLPPPHWEWEAGLDWGFSSPGWFGLGAFGEEGREHLFWEVPYNGHHNGGERLTPFEVGERCGRAILAAVARGARFPRRIVYDASMKDTGDGRGGLHVSDIEKFTEGMRSVLGDNTPPMMPCTKGQGSRETRVRLFHESIRYTAQQDGAVLRSGLPRFSYHPRCAEFATTVPALPRDPANPDDVDTKANDHPFDGWTYLTALRPKHAAPLPLRKDPDTHQGLASMTRRQDDDGARRWSRE